MKKKLHRKQPSRANAVGLLLGRISGRLQLEVQRSLQHAGLKLTLPQWQLLTVIADANQLSQSTLSGLTDKDRANVTRILEALEAAGYVERFMHADDKRRYTVSITDKGVEVEAVARALASEVEQRMLRKIPAPERRSVLNLLDQMSRNLA